MWSLARAAIALAARFRPYSGGTRVSVTEAAIRPFADLRAAGPDCGHEPGQAAGFRKTVLVAVEAAARTHRGAPIPTLADMIRKVTAALDAA
ncbi:hypothetical protein [Nonomuraea roseola]|uniref:Uncharacterized protein n=1 Tax=Nonomuraea roseola TaxID=46179 RepID=A0ABV5QD64_9ACTN